VAVMGDINDQNLRTDLNNDTKRL